MSKSQNEATAMQRDMSLDNPTVSLAQTMVAMQTAQDRVRGDAASEESLVHVFNRCSVVE